MNQKFEPDFKIVVDKVAFERKIIELMITSLKVRLFLMRGDLGVFFFDNLEGASCQAVDVRVRYITT